MIWRISERFGMRPPGVKDNFLECYPWVQAQLFAYNQIREYEEMEMAAAGVKV